MSKIRITDNEKIKIIESHIQGEMGFVEIRNKYGVPKSTLQHWIRRYQTFSVDGLLCRKRDYEEKSVNKIFYDNDRRKA